MIISVASGKGGTGKTLVAVNLALSLDKAQIIDCDVEEPNVHLFLKPDIASILSFKLPVPKILEEKCDYCGECARFCQYHALFVVDNTALVFSELCHSCGGCSIVCPRKAIMEEPREIGRIMKGSAGPIDLVYGELNIGEPSAVSLIAAIKKHINIEDTVILDAPPGAACPFVETIQGSDFCLLVTEPTPFGLHDLEIAVKVVKELSIPMGVVVNFAGIGDKGVFKFCNQHNLPIMMEIPFDRRIAELYSKGIPFVEEMPEWKLRFKQLAGLIEGERDA
ncbi:ATP-binding protein [Candidatus Bathyarchaeota archaeon]|nr:ATP-binding protein [Candidatus Bathyarchaeota archaeon]